MPETLTKAMLAGLLHDRVGLTKKEGADLVDHLLDLMRDALRDGDNLKISAFGSWAVRDKHARPGRNPQTNERITISRRRVITFKPSPVLRRALNEDV